MYFCHIECGCIYFNCIQSKQNLLTHENDMAWEYMTNTVTPLCICAPACLTTSG